MLKWVDPASALVDYSIFSLSIVACTCMSHVSTAISDFLLASATGSRGAEVADGERGAGEGPEPDRVSEGREWGR